MVLAGGVAVGLAKDQAQQPVGIGAFRHQPHGVPG